MSRLKVVKNQKGFFVMEYMMSFLIFILLFCFVFDLIMVTIQRHQASTLLQDVVRIVQVQGGIEPSLPENYHGTNQTYLDSGELMSLSRQILGRAGVIPDTYEFVIEGVDESNAPISETISSSSNVQLKYRTPFTIRLEYDFRWTLWSSIMPSSARTRQVLRTTGITEYKRDYDMWDKEW